MRNLSTWGWNQEGKVQGQLQLHSAFEASWGNAKFCLQQNKLVFQGGVADAYTLGTQRLGGGGS